MTDDLKAKFYGKNTLITGGMGFIGSNLAQQLLALGANITLIDTLHPKHGGNPFNIEAIKNHVNSIIADMGDERRISPLIPRQDYIFNLAGQVSHTASMSDPQHDLALNAASHLALVEMCQKLNPHVKIIYGGTRQVYGVPQYLPVDENHPVAPIDYNGVSKMAGEWYHLIAHRNYGLRAASLRMTNVYGPRMRVRDALKTFIGAWFRLLIEGRELKIYGSGQQLRDLNYVDDVVSALLLVAAHPASDGKIYNLGSDEHASLLDLARLMIEVNQGGSYRLTPFPAARKRIDIGDYYGDYTKINREVGWSPKIKLREGIRRTLEYYREHRKHYWTDAKYSAN
ncbi:MAG: NAD-dependent epimerase/dehydratase family protein [Anaerolineales bacterium]|jgi:nucleoside-diphosphate-sugar epimerase|nr:NAD-dependent epimerase/dehydratase family protein [Anaerolineales bacterium]